MTLKKFLQHTECIMVFGGLRRAMGYTDESAQGCGIWT